MQKISPCFWFDKQAEEAAKFYTSIFKNSRILNTHYYGEEGPGKPGTVMTIIFQLEGQEFTAINGGPEFKFTPAISLYVDCDSQGEVDELWEKLSEGGEKGQCGWLTDKYGVSWQIVPTILIALMQDKDPVKARRVTQALYQMTKIDIEKIKHAYEMKSDYID